MKMPEVVPGTLHAFEPPRVGLTTRFPHAPGSPVRFSLADGTVYEGRTMSCRRGEGQAFTVEARLVNLSRVLRQRLQACHEDGIVDIMVLRPEGLRG